MDAMWVFGLGLRLLALVQCLAFYALFRDVLGIAGSRGLQPVGDVLHAYKRHYGLRRFLYAPSLLHFAHSDRALRGWLLLGMLSALGSALGGPLSPLLFAASWLIYLSFDVAVDLLYPWDALLLEAGLLAVLAPPLRLLEVSVNTEPNAILVWLFRLLAFRVVFGFGKYKFFGPGKLDSAYLKSFLVTQPMPRRLGLRLQRWPTWTHQLGLLMLFFIEVLSPWFWLGGPSWRWIPSLAVGSLMLVIQLTGNFGFFNLAMGVLCILGLTPSTSPFDLSVMRTAMTWHWEEVAALAYLGIVLCHLPFQSWIARSWMYWPGWRTQFGPGIAPLLALLRVIAPFRIVHAYGVFGPECGPRGQWIPRFEATQDGVHWLPYKTRYYPSEIDYRGSSISPLFPRFDHALIYEAMGLGLGNLTGSLVGGGEPFRATRALFLERAQRRLLEASPEVLALFASAPFGTEKPHAVRVTFSFHALVEDEADVAFRVLPMGHHLPARTLADAEPIAPPEPEAFLADERVWAERAVPSTQASTTPSSLLSLEAKLAELVQHAAPRALFDFAETHRATLRELEPYVLRRAWTWRKERLAREGEFELWLTSLAHALALPEIPATGLLVLAVLRPTWVRFHARKARLRASTMRAAAAKPPAFVPGVLRWMDALAALDQDDTPLPRFERIGDRGQWHVGDAKPSNVAQS